MTAEGTKKIIPENSTALISLNRLLFWTYKLVRGRGDRFEKFQSREMRNGFQTGVSESTNHVRDFKLRINCGLRCSWAEGRRGRSMPDITGGNDDSHANRRVKKQI